MKKFMAVLALFCFSFSAIAVESVIFTGPQGSITLYKTPCVAEKVVSLIKPEALQLYQAARVFWQEKEYHACWRIDPGNSELVFIVDEEGDVGQAPMAIFRPNDPS